MDVEPATSSSMSLPPMAMLLPPTAPTLVQTTMHAQSSLVAAAAIVTEPQTSTSSALISGPKLTPQELNDALDQPSGNKELGALFSSNILAAVQKLSQKG
uniref:Uncharacterized protein n=1 Tax=Romanomermis culicivorax TaxID=13658 RepID=A0A915IKP9_ROMCU